MYTIMKQAESLQSFNFFRLVDVELTPRKPEWGCSGC